MVESTATGQNIEKRTKGNEDSIRDLWDNVEHTSIHIVGGPRRRREKGPEKIFEEIITENFPNMGKKIVSQVQEAQSVPNRMNPRKHTLRHSNQTDKT